jgi:hypothetical protein
MSTLTEARPRVKPQLQALVCDCGGGLVNLNIFVLDGRRTRSDFYFVERIACDDLAYSLRKMDVSRDGTDPEETQYEINVTTGTCSCKGHVRWGHCKHEAAVRLAYERGGLPS